MTKDTDSKKSVAGTGVPDGVGKAARARREPEPGREAREESPKTDGAQETAAGGAEREGPPVEVSAQPSPGGDLAARNAELLDSLVRLKAEFENYRKRMLKEQTRLLETAESGLVKKLLPVVDNLERALESEPGVSPEGDGLRKGVEMVLGQLLELLGREGLEVIDPGGEPFDPEHHEAMMVVESDECPEDTVIDVVQKGYRFNGILLRPAMVRVSCHARGS